MTAVTLRATAIDSASTGYDEVGGPVQTILQDGTEASYVLFENPGAIVFRMGAFTVGTGRLKTITLSMHMLSDLFNAGGNPPPPGSVVAEFGPVHRMFGFITIASSTGAWYNTAPIAAPALTQADIDAMTLTVNWFPSAEFTTLRIHELALVVVHAAAPTSTVTYPTAGLVVATSSPTVTWTHTAGSDGGPQSHYEIKVFTAAQYGAGGFSPDSSAYAWSSGQVTGSATSATVGPLANNEDFRVYVRTAQAINSVAHWSAWSFNAFSTDYAPANPTSVTTSPNHSAGYIAVTVAIPSSPSWVSMEIERSTDGGDFVPVRGATHVAETNTHVTTWSTTSVVVRDYEAPNGASVVYRARATRSTGTVGSWVESLATSWASPHPRAVWLKDPHNPALNVEVGVQEFPQPTTDVVSGVFHVIGAKNPTIVTDTRTGRAGTFVVQTTTLAEARALQAATAGANQFKLLQFPEAHLWGSTYVHLGPAQEMHPDLVTDIGVRAWQIAYTEIDRPADETDY